MGGNSREAGWEGGEEKRKGRRYREESGGHGLKSWTAQMRNYQVQNSAFIRLSVTGFFFCYCSVFFVSVKDELLQF